MPLTLSVLCAHHRLDTIPRPDGGRSAVLLEPGVEVAVREFALGSVSSWNSCLFGGVACPPYTAGVRIGVLLIGVFFAGSALANEYRNQVEMTATLLDAPASSFDRACLRLKGKLVKGEGISKCERGRSLLAISYVEEVVTWAMIAYPATPEDIEGLWQTAQELLGKPDSVTERELTWRLSRGVMASAGYDHEYSTFILARPKGH